jgi:hypothetical protein
MAHRAGEAALAAGELRKGRVVLVVIKKKVVYCSLRNTRHGVKSRWPGGKARQRNAQGDWRRRKRRTRARPGLICDFFFEKAW